MEVPEFLDKVSLAGGVLFEAYLDPLLIYILFTFGTGERLLVLLEFLDIGDSFLTALNPELNPLGVTALANRDNTPGFLAFL